MIGLSPIRQRLFGISPDETKFARRGFPAGEVRVQQHLELAGGAFVEGYNCAVAKPQAEEIGARLNEIEPMYRGFAFEGAAMALALFDLITPWDRGRFDRFLKTRDGDANLYMLYVGAGWAMARIPWVRRNFERAMLRYPPLYRWLTLDGYGFHQGFFHYHEHVAEQRVPRGLSHHAACVFDQGLGRSMWFSCGADAERIAATVAAFPETRQADVWSGLGLAASYAGGVERGVLEDVLSAASAFSANLAQGAAFAAKARNRAGNPVPHTVMACNVFCRMPANEAAAVTDDCLVDLPPDVRGDEPRGSLVQAEPAYQVWRSRISASFSLAGRGEKATMAGSGTV